MTERQMSTEASVQVLLYALQEDKDPPNIIYSRQTLSEGVRHFSSTPAGPGTASADQSSCYVPLAKQYHAPTRQTVARNVESTNENSLLPEVLKW